MLKHTSSLLSRYDLINTLTGNCVRTIAMSPSEKDDRNFWLEKNKSHLRWFVSVAANKNNMQRA